MNIAVFGQTLYAGVMAALLAECGHQVYWLFAPVPDTVLARI